MKQSRLRRGPARARRVVERYRLLRRERRARERAERAERRAMFLAEAGLVLAGAFEAPARVLAELTRLAVPHLADWCAVRLVRDGVVETAALAHVDPEREAAMGRLRPSYVVRAREGVPPVVLRERSVVVNGTQACTEALMAMFPDPRAPQREVLREILCVAGISAYMAIPLAARGRVFGAMLFASIREDRTYGREEQVLAEALAAHAALALDNARLYDEAQRALAAREDFLAVASHELKTPLTSLQMAVQALLRQARAGAGERSPSWGAPLLGAVERSAARLGALVDDLLDISHLTGDGSHPARDEVDLDEVVSEVVGASADVLRGAGCAVQRTARGPTGGSWDRQWLVRIVTNLLSNAAKYGAGRPIDLDVEGGEHTVRLTVRDRGIGIAEEEQARIFDRFERAVSARHYGGFGLGLWIVRRMVQALGGSIRVESRPGEGAAFTVELPRRGA